MPNYTPNLNLKKPLHNENYNVEDQNGNMDLLDAAVVAAETNAKSYADTKDTEHLAAPDPHTQYALDTDLAGHLVEDATEEELGHVELATPTETATGTDGTRAVTPLGLKSATNLLIPLTQKGVAGGVPELGADGKLVASQAPIPFSAGEVVAFSNDTVSYNGSLSYSIVVPAWGVTIGASGKVRVSFGMKAQNASYIVYARIYLNGVGVGIERSTTSTTLITFTEDITVNAGDAFQIYAKCTNISASVYVGNLRIKVASTPVIK